MRVTGVLVFLLICIANARAADTLRLSLSDAIDIALQQNFDVRIARQDSMLAANMGESAITGFLPKLNLAGSTSTGKTDLRQTMADGRLISKDQAGITNLSGSATLSWMLFDGFKMFANKARLEALQEQGAARLRATMQTVIADVVTSYFGLVANQKVLAALDSAMALAEQRFNIVQEQYAVGITSGVQLAQARIDLNAQRSLLIRMHADEANASSALLTLLGRSPQGIVIADQTTPDYTLPPQATLAASLDSLNPDVLVLQHSLEAASAHVRETNAAFFPQLGVSASFQFNRTDQDAGFVLKNQTGGWNVGAQLQWNIFNGFADNLAREQALLQVQSATLEIGKLRNELHGQLDRIYRAYTTAAAQVSIEETSFADAQQNATVAIAGLKIGTVNALDVRQALLSLLDSAQSLAQREYEQRLAATELLRLTGGIVR